MRPARLGRVGEAVTDRNSPPGAGLSSLIASTGTQKPNQRDLEQALHEAGDRVRPRHAGARQRCLGEGLRRHRPEHHPVGSVRQRAAAHQPRSGQAARDSAGGDVRRTDALFDNVTDGDLTKYFKSEALNSLGTDGPGTPEEVPGHPEIQITRDIYNVPHVVAQTHEGGVFAAGWIAAEDRGLLLNQARYNARVAAIDAPGLSAIGLVSQLKSFVPSAQTEAEVAKQTQALEAQGKEGEAVLADIDTFIEGINYYNSIHSPSTAPFTRNDIYALNALKDQFLGEGGGDEARRTQFLSGLQDRLGQKKGMSVFNDLRQFKNNGVPTTIDGRFPYGKIPKQPKGNVLIDHGSYQTTPAVQNQALARQLERHPVQASNTLMITKGQSTNNRPLMVGGPQISYFYPGLTYEIDMNAPGLVWRGATSAPFPGYLLIGRGEDFATTLTSASGDVIDQYAETLCNGSDTSYKYKGKCREMGTFDAGTLNGDPVVFKTTVH
ncbi:MAG: penicillin acylase family protein, partial [Solirubrobacterales bacterium]